MLLPLIEFLLVLLAYRSVLISTINTIKYFSVATAVEQAANDGPDPNPNPDHHPNPNRYPNPNPNPNPSPNPNPNPKP